MLNRLAIVCILGYEFFILGCSAHASWNRLPAADRLIIAWPTNGTAACIPLVPMFKKAAHRNVCG
jgi:hypothetical protein